MSAATDTVRDGATSEELVRCRERIRARARRWEALCRELSAHAEELRQLRKELKPRGDDERGPAELAIQRREQQLQQLAARLEHERRELARDKEDFEFERQQWEARHRAAEQKRLAAADRHLLRAARLEFEARRSMAEVESWAAETARVEQELDGMFAEISTALADFSGECDALGSPRHAPAAESMHEGHRTMAG